MNVEGNDTDYHIMNEGHGYMIKDKTFEKKDPNLLQNTYFLFSKVSKKHVLSVFQRKGTEQVNQYYKG